MRVFDSSHNITGSQVQLRFQLTQQSRDLVLMENIVKYLSCGKISKRGDIVDIHVTKFTDVIEKIIPFFDRYPVIGVKRENFNDFSRPRIHTGSVCRAHSSFDERKSSFNKRRSRTNS